MDYGPLLGGPAGQGTHRRRHRRQSVRPAPHQGRRRARSFPRRHRVTGRAETIKSGGRVVKNVTGYDMCKLLAGSWGTLAAMTDVTIKVLPKPETEATVLVTGLDDARACAAMAAAMGSACDVSGAAHLPDHVASYFDGLPKPEASTVLRLEGVAPSVAHRKDALAALMKPFGPVALLDEKDFERALAQRARGQAVRREAARERPLWRISTAPARGHELVDLITPAAQMFYDWAGGLVWVAMPFAHEPDAAAVRGAVGQARRPRHAGARAGLGARRARRVRAAGGGPWPRSASA